MYGALSLPYNTICFICMVLHHHYTRNSNYCSFCSFILYRCSIYFVYYLLSKLFRLEYQSISLVCYTTICSISPYRTFKLSKKVPILVYISSTRWHSHNIILQMPPPTQFIFNLQAQAPSIAPLLRKGVEHSSVWRVVYFIRSHITNPKKLLQEW